MYHEFVLDRVASSSLSLGNEEALGEEEHLTLLGAWLAACLDMKRVLREETANVVNQFAECWIMF